MARYFKKFTPTNAVVVLIEGAQTKIPFDSIDGVIGYYGTEAKEVSDQLETFIKQQRYGLTEVSQEEYMTQYAEKKMSPNPSKTVWREELSRSGGVGLVDNESGRLGSESVQRALAVAERSDIRPSKLAAAALAMGEHLAGSQPIQAGPAAEKAEEIKVNVGARVKPQPGKKNANQSKASS